MRSSISQTMMLITFFLLHLLNTSWAVPTTSSYDDKSKTSKKIHTLDLHHHPIHSTSRDVTSPRFVTYAALDRDNYVKESALPTDTDQLVKNGTLAQNTSNLLPVHPKSSHLSRTGLNLLHKIRGANLAVTGNEEPSKKHSKHSLRFDAAWNLHVGWVENAKSDSEFLLEIGVGTPTQKFLASIDTASPLTWLYTEQCCFSGNHSFFKPNHSSTFSNRTLDSNGQPIAANKGMKAQQFEIQYGGQGTGSVDVNLGFDTVEVLPATKGFRIKEQTIGLVQNITNAKRGQGRDLRQMEAILGLSPGNGTAVPGKLHTPIEELIINEVIKDPMFTVSFVKAHGSERAKGGRFIIGGLDHENMQGNVTWIASTSNLFWGFEFDKGAMKYGNIDIWPADQLRRVIIDTGSSGIYLPTAAAKRVNEAIAGSHYDIAGSRWLIPCDTGILPHEKHLGAIQRAHYFSIRLGGQVFVVPTVDLVLFPSNPIEIDLDKRTMCNSAVQGGSEHFAVLGNTFIKNHAITFKYGGKDLSNRQIGFAHRRDTGIDLQAAHELLSHVAEDTDQTSVEYSDDC